MKRLFYGFLLLASFAIAGCDSLTGTDFKPDYVVESYQIAREPFARLRLSQSVPINTEYIFEDHAVSGATVQVHLLAPDGSVETTYTFSEHAGHKGVYYPATEDLVLPRRTYRLEITLPNSNERITAQTTVPDTFRVVSANKTRGIYQEPEQIRVTMTKTRSDLSQPVYAVSNLALDASEENMVPFIRNVYENSDGDVTIDQLSQSEAPLINEGSFATQSPTEIQFDLPWITVAFYGRQVMTISNIDRNLWDFIRSRNVQSGGSTLSPGEIPNILEHIDGGTGIFGSFSKVEFQYIVDRP